MKFIQRMIALFKAKRLARQAAFYRERSADYHTAAKQFAEEACRLEIESRWMRARSCER
jgi:hypothetical protein